MGNILWKHVTTGYTRKSLVLGYSLLLALLKCKLCFWKKLNTLHKVRFFFTWKVFEKFQYTKEKFYKKGWYKMIVVLFVWKRWRPRTFVAACGVLVMRLRVLGLPLVCIFLLTLERWLI